MSGWPNIIVHFMKNIMKTYAIANALGKEKKEKEGKTVAFAWKKCLLALLKIS
jgi:hypothetical protein